MKRMFFFVIVLLLNLHAIFADSEDADVNVYKNLLGNATLGPIADTGSLSSIFDSVKRKSGIAFCIEETLTDSDVFRGQKGHASLSGKSLATFLDQLRQDGYTIKTTNHVILVVGPRVKSMRKNPLENRVNGFVFEGSHKEFYIALTKYFGEYSPRTVISSEERVQYKINLTNEMTLRDLLLHVASESGVGYSITIAEEPVAYEVSRPDGLFLMTNKTIPVTLIFRQYNAGKAALQK